jgi:hypothetical protein
MIPAIEAYNDAMKFHEVEAQGELEKIEELIDSSKSKGQLYCMVTTISDNLVKKLENWGYKVNQANSVLSGKIFIIDWDLSKV